MGSSYVLWGFFKGVNQGNQKKKGAFFCNFFPAILLTFLGLSPPPKEKRGGGTFLPRGRESFFLFINGGKRNQIFFPSKKTKKGQSLGTLQKKKLRMAGRPGSFWLLKTFLKKKKTLFQRITLGGRHLNWVIPSFFPAKNRANFAIFFFTHFFFWAGLFHVFNPLKPLVKKVGGWGEDMLEIFFFPNWGKISFTKTLGAPQMGGPIFWGGGRGFWEYPGWTS